MRNEHRNGFPGEVVLDQRASHPAGSDHPSNGRRGLSTARAVLRVLSFMAEHPEGVSAREVAEELGKSVSTAYYLLASLSEEGFAIHQPGLGYRLRSAAAPPPLAPESPLPIRLSRVLSELFARTHRRSYLAHVQVGAIVITAVAGRQGVPRVPGLGPRIGRSAHALALGKVVLSLLPEHSRRRYIERGLRSYTPGTITSPGALMTELDRVRQHGVAIDRGEFDVNYCTLAAPIFDPPGRFLAVLGLSTPRRTFEAEAQDLVATLRELAAGAGRPYPYTKPTNPTY
jgi:DNA-binding IclR family transcriptional regulator